MASGAEHTATMHEKRQSTCPVGGADEDAYNLPLHVGALFIILFVSTMACSFPMLAAKFPRLKLSTNFFFAVRHFGTGVLLATAFVHLLPTAFILLGDRCLPSFWTEDYPAMPGAIALAGIFLVVSIEMVFHPSRHLDPKPGTTSPTPPVVGNSTTPRMRHMAPLGGRSSSIGRGLSTIHTDNDQSTQQVADKEIQTVDAEGLYLSSTEETFTYTKEQEHRKEIMQCVLLEVGILFHSIFIGLALSVSIGSEFVILLIAIAFHQSFEGLALGSRIAAIKWPSETYQPWFMALAYGCTTPIGQAIGLAVHSLYTPESEVGLVLMGTMNAISAGLLTFASLVELLSEDLLSDNSWKVLRGTKRLVACLLVFAGAFLMSLIGAWA